MSHQRNVGDYFFPELFVFVLCCVGGGLSAGQTPVQNDLLNVYKRDSET
jgi:hypothetical protein